MGGINIKLMQGIEDAENQLQEERQPQKAEEPARKGETGDTQKTAGKLQAAKKQIRPKKDTVIRKKDGNEPDKMSKKQVFSFRAVLADIVAWKAYAVASGKTMEDICNAAMHEYLKKHKLSGTDGMIFEALQAREENRKDKV